MDSQPSKEEDKKAPHPFCVMYPFITILRVMGIIYVRTDSKYNRFCTGRFTKVFATLGFIYCCATVILQWLDLIKNLVQFKDNETDNFFSAELYDKIFQCLWTLQCATYGSFLLKISYKDELFKFMDDLEDHYNRYTGKDKLVYSKWLKMHIYGWTLASAIMITIMFGTSLYFKMEGFFDPSPFPREGPLATVGLVFLGYISFMGSALVYFTICLFAIVCGIVYKEFVTTRENLECIIQSNSSCGETNLRRIRQRHQNLCSMVQQGNGMFSGILAVLYTTNIFMACLMSYNLLDGNLSTVRMVIGAFWTLAAFLNFLGISVLASFLNSAAHSPVESLYDICITSSTKVFLTDLQMFTARLTGPQIGFTVYDLFVINRPTILTVAGMFLTYFFLLLQFRSPQTTSGEDMAKSCAPCLANFTLFDNSSAVNCSFM